MYLKNAKALYSAESVIQIVKRAAHKAGIKQHVSPHI